MMLNKKTITIIFIALMLFSLNIKAQVLFNMGDYRNLAYTDAGYSNGYPNITLSIARRDYFRLMKREIVGVLDVSLPLTTDRFLTKRSVRKGFQFDIYKKNDFRIPCMLASSSIFRENQYYKLHDVSAELGITPGIYRQKYTLALDFKYELIIFRFRKYTNYYLTQINPDAKSHWEHPFFNIAKVGFVAGLNFKRTIIYLKSGYERNPTANRNNLPVYALVGFGYKFGTRPIRY